MRSPLTASRTEKELWSLRGEHSSVFAAARTQRYLCRGLLYLAVLNLWCVPACMCRGWVLKLGLQQTQTQGEAWAWLHRQPKGLACGMGHNHGCTQKRPRPAAEAMHPCPPAQERRGSHRPEHPPLRRGGYLPGADAGGHHARESNALRHRLGGDLRARSGQCVQGNKSGRFK